MHLPAWDPSMLERAEEVIQQNPQQISLVLHCHQEAQLHSKDLCRDVLSVLPCITSLSLTAPQDEAVCCEEWQKTLRSLQLELCLQVLLLDSDSTFTDIMTLLRHFKIYDESEFLADLYCHVVVHHGESQTGKKLLSSLQMLYMSAPAVWSIDLSNRKASLFLEVLKLQPWKKPVELRGWSDKESEVRSFLQCLPYISQLRFIQVLNQNPEDWMRKLRLFHLDLCVQAALFQEEFTFPVIQTLLNLLDITDESNFMFDLYAHVNGIEFETQKKVLKALHSVYQSVPENWSIDLSERKASLFLEILEFQMEKKPVELTGWSEDESEVRSFLQCLPYISQLSCNPPRTHKQSYEEWIQTVRGFQMNLCQQGLLHEKECGHTGVQRLLSLCSLHDKSVFLLDLYSYMKDCENQTGRRLLSALQKVFQSFPTSWSIDLSEGKISILLEVLKLQTQKKPLELRGWTDEESEERSFFQCLPYISELKLRLPEPFDETEERYKIFRLDLCLKAALYCKDCSLSSVQTLLNLLHTLDDSEFLLDLFSHVMDFESKTGSGLLPVFVPVYGSGPAVWSIDLSERKVILLLEVLKLQTQKKPVELRGWSDEESEVRSFLQCLPYVSQLRLKKKIVHDSPKEVLRFLLDLSVAAAVSDAGESVSELLCSVCTFTFEEIDELNNNGSSTHSEFLLDLCSHLKDVEIKTGRVLLPTLQPFYWSAPAVWSIDFSKTKVSLLLELLKLQTQKKTVQLLGWSDEEIEVRSFLQCLPYISQLRFAENNLNDRPKEVFQFLVNLSVAAAVSESAAGKSFPELLCSVCTFPFDEIDRCAEYYNGSHHEFLLDLYSRVKDAEIRTGRSLLSALQPFNQSIPAVWTIDLSKRRVSVFLEVLKLQTQRKPVVLIQGWSDDESEVRSFLQCLPYISQLRFTEDVLNECPEEVFRFLLDLSVAAAVSDSATGERLFEHLCSVCTFPFEEIDKCDHYGNEFLLDLFSRVKDIEILTGRSFLSVLQPLYQSAPAVWSIDLSKGRLSVFLEVLKLQTQKKPVELRSWSDDESEVRSFLQCLPFISQLRFTPPQLERTSMEEWEQGVKSFCLNLCLQASLCETESLLTTVKSLLTLSSVYNESDLLLDLYSYVRDYESQIGRSFVPELQPFYQLTPAVWSIDLSKRKASLLLEVLKLQTQKIPVELRGWSDEESEVRSFLQCLAYISQLIFTPPQFGRASLEEWKQGVKSFCLNLCLQASLYETESLLTTVRSLLTLSSVYNESDLLLDLYSYVRDYESQIGRSFVPVLQPIYQAIPAVWFIDLSKRKASVLLEVLKLQTQKKPVELRGWSDEESEVRSFLQCLPYISQLSFTSPQYVRMSSEEWALSVRSSHRHLCLQAALYEWTSVRTLITLFRVDNESDFLLDLYHYVRDYEYRIGRSLIPALRPVYQSIPAVWSIDLSKRKASLFLEVLKLQTQKKPVELRGWSGEESEVRSFLQCLPFISQLSFTPPQFVGISLEEWEHSVRSSHLHLCLQAALYEWMSVRTLITLFRVDNEFDFLLDLYYYVRDYEYRIGRSLITALQPVYQTITAVWSIDLSKRKASLLLEVLKLQTQKKPVQLLGWSDEESEVRSFLQCLPYISQLSFTPPQSEGMSLEEWEHCVKSSHRHLCLQAALYEWTSVRTLITLFRVDNESDFLLDLCYHMRNYGSQIEHLIPALRQVYQAIPAVWSIDLSERKASVLLEVLKLQTQKRPVELRGWSDEESEVRSFLQCLPYISQLRFTEVDLREDSEGVLQFLLDLSVAAAVSDLAAGESFSELLCSVCTFPFEKIDEWDDNENSSHYDFLLNLYFHVKNIEIKTGRIFLPRLHPFYQSAPGIWSIDLSKRKASLLLEVLKLQTQKKPVELRGWSDKMTEVRSFLQCLPYISQLSFWDMSGEEELFNFLANLSVAAAECDAATGESFSELLSSVCSYSTFPISGADYASYHTQFQNNFLLNLYSHMKETKTSRSVYSLLQSVYQSAPAVWSVDLSERKASLLLEVLKFQTQKKPVQLRGWSDEESEVRSFLQCLPYISQLRFTPPQFERTSLEEWEQVKSVCLSLCLQASLCETESLLTTVRSLLTLSSVYNESEILLDLYCYVRDYESQIGRSLIPALQPVCQLIPAVWSIDLLERKASLFLEVLKLQTQKKPVELLGWSDEECEVRSFLQCLPFISQLKFQEDCVNGMLQFLLKLSVAAAEYDAAAGESFSELLSSVCTFPFERTDEEYGYEYLDFLLDLCSRVKDIEIKTGKRLLPPFKPFYQSGPEHWLINPRRRKSSILLEVLKLQKEKKSVEVLYFPDEESEVRSFLQCLPYISQLSFWDDMSEETIFNVLANLSVAAAECDAATGESYSELLSSVCSYSTFPISGADYASYHTQFQNNFLLNLYSHMKETKTSRSVYSLLQSVYQSAPAVWSIDLSKRKASLLLEVLKLQTQKKPVELRGWSDEESEVRSFLQCLPYISQLSLHRAYGGKPFLLDCAAGQLSTEKLIHLVELLDNIELKKDLFSRECRSLGRVLSVASKLDLTLTPKHISLRGVRLLFRGVTHLHKLRLNVTMVMRLARAMRTGRGLAPVSVEELSLDLDSKKVSQRALSRVLSCLALLLRLWTVQCLDLTSCRVEGHSLIILLCQQDPLKLRLSKENTQQLFMLVSDAQEMEIIESFLNKVGRDLTSCTLTQEVLHLLKHHSGPVTVDFRQIKITERNIRDFLHMLDRIQFKRLTPGFIMCIIMEIYQSRSPQYVSSLLRSTENHINLTTRGLDAADCAALRFTLQHSQGVRLNLMWTSIPEGELESLLQLLSNVSQLSVDRQLLLRFLHCCESSDVQQGAAAALLQALQHRLDFSCSSAMDLTEETQEPPLHLRPEDCRVISMGILRVSVDPELMLMDCDVEEAGLEHLFSVLERIRLRCSKGQLLQLLVCVGSERECVRRAVSLSHAVGGEVDLSHTVLDARACGSLALFLEYSEGLSELDLSHCQLTDQCLEPLLPHLHKSQSLDLSNNSLTDEGAQLIYNTVNAATSIQSVRLFNNKIRSRQLFQGDARFELR
ncbi:uncharacterized protein LOC134060303 [Sardina pilchardus]|uniref:uncharacterized protein LOC134060303 n=1 Tax=Sardina pilchardus TaxID=27697 RepID=UPI002E0D231A